MANVYSPGGALGTREYSWLLWAGTRVPVEQPGTRGPGDVRCVRQSRKNKMGCLDLVRGREGGMAIFPSPELPG